MNEKELMDKLARELPLTAAEEAWLDSHLAEQTTSPVGALPQEEPSLAWRSELNERLLALQPKPKRRPWFLVGGLASGAAAAALAWAMLAPTTKVMGPAGSIEADMVASHELLVQQASAGLLVDDGAQPVNQDVLEWMENPDDSL
ncbi:MAG: hypothetical protein JNJ45_06545 [Chthonomonas sp.]|nr:hypothetical protein [Chthonomonas sp.]